MSKVLVMLYVTDKKDNIKTGIPLMIDENHLNTIEQITMDAGCGSGVNCYHYQIAWRFD